MPSQNELHPVSGSARTSLPGASVVGEVDPSQRIIITLKLRERGSDKTIRSQARALAAVPLAQRSYLTRDEFAEQHGADPNDIALVVAFAHDHGLTVVETNVAERSLKVSGTIEDLSRAFAVKLHHYKAHKVQYRGRTGPVYVPKNLADIVVAVQGFDNRPVAKAHVRSRRAEVDKGQAAPHNDSDGSLSALDVASVYNFPKQLDGSGQCIALIELNDIDTVSNRITGSGYAVSDLQAYFKNLNLPMPKITALSVDGGTNVPGLDVNADGEVTLDIQIAGAVAPAASIMVYFAPNTDQGFTDAVNKAIHDSVNTPSIVSISWGGPEDFATSQYLDGMDKTLAAAALMGVTVCVAAGDDGSADMIPSIFIDPTDPNPPREWDGVPHVDFPASSPHVLSCGGTRLLGSGSSIVNETVWNDGRDPNGGGAGGGGVSNKFPLPDYQKSLKIPLSPTGSPGRGVPDVAGNADPATGYRVFVNGIPKVIGGTSAVAPLWAGLLARINQGRAQKGKKVVGFLNPLIYGDAASQSEAFRDIDSGSNDIIGTLNGLYSAAKGWDACTGLGSPIGTQLLALLEGTELASPSAEGPQSGSLPTPPRTNAAHLELSDGNWTLKIDLQSCAPDRDVGAS